MSYNNYLIIMLLKRILFLLLMFVGFLEGSAEEVTEVTIKFKTIDKLTNRTIYLLDVKLYNAEDTSFVRSFYKEYREHNCILKDAKPGSKYLIRIDNIDQSSDYYEYFKEDLIKQGRYEPQWLELLIPEGRDIIELPVVKLSRPKRKEPEQLNELTVTASKVMFYHKGDTLIYNADAFLIGEASMLDDLISQLPGVELKSDGRIYCNGKYVERLLLNSRDLFNGDNELMLENLSAYTVKNIAVYDKLGNNSKLLGAKLAGDTQYVMDVRLKREYANGWIVNTEEGYGSEERYLGKFFGMWYSDNASITAYGGANNLSDMREPGSGDGSWSPADMAIGTLDRIFGGVTYSAEGPEEKWRLRGDVKYSRDNHSISTNRNTQNFFDTGDTYEYSWGNSKDHYRSISTSHKLNYRIADKVNLYLNPNFSYNKSDVNETSTQALFSREIRDISEQMVKNIYNTGDTLSRHYINRRLYESIENSKSINAGFEASAFIAISKNPKHRQSLSVVTSASYHNRESATANQYSIDYSAASMPGERARQIFRGNPHWDKRASVKAQYVKFFNSDFRYFDLTYEYSFLAERRTSILYMLDEETGFDFDSPISQLPSMREYAPFIDADQSNIYRYDEHRHRIDPKYHNNIKLAEDKEITINTSIPINIWSRIMHYQWPALDKLETIKRNNVKPGFRARVFYNYKPEDGWFSMPGIAVSLEPAMAPLLSIVDRVNNTDPLNISMGNPDLRDSYQLSVSLSTEHFRPHRSARHNASINYTTIFNQFARGFVYNPATGVRTYKTYNINGNWVLSGNHQYYSAFGRNNSFRLEVRTTPMYAHSVDLAGAMTEMSGDMPPRRTIGSLSLNEYVRFNWQVGRNRMSAFTSARVSHYSSSDKGFNNFTSWTCNYGISETLNLPYEWSLSSDMTLYTRRGFVDSRLNTTDLVWNARVTKSILKGSLTFALDAYDMLHQLSNINYGINAQARTEAVCNVIPAYVLFHVQWRFNKQPKKW